MMTLAWILAGIGFLCSAGIVWCCVALSGRCSEAEFKCKMYEGYLSGEWDEGESQEEEAKQ